MSLQKAKRPCRSAGCSSTTALRYCEKHHFLQAREDAQRARARELFALKNKRESASARGYDRKWQEFRKLYIRSHPLCYDCSKEGHVGATTEVHHIKKLKHNPELKYDLNNLMGLCKLHHLKRTQRGE